MSGRRIRESTGRWVCLVRSGAGAERVAVLEGPGDDLLADPSGDQFNAVEVDVAEGARTEVRGKPGRNLGPVEVEEQEPEREVFARLVRKHLAAPLAQKTLKRKERRMVFIGPVRHPKRVDEPGRPLHEQEIAASGLGIFVAIKPEGEGHQKVVDLVVGYHGGIFGGLIRGNVDLLRGLFGRSEPTHQPLTIRPPPSALNLSESIELDRSEPLA